VQLLLKGRQCLELVAEPQASDTPAVGAWVKLKVVYCAVCRADAKMWEEGHRDVVLPRVQGHEIVAEDDAGKRYAIWPGSSCGACDFCRRGRENLCAEMKILGFHLDGGFSDSIMVPKGSMIPLPAGLPARLATFAEPVGCAINALRRLALGAGERIVIYGGGTMRIIAGLYAAHLGAVPTIVEKNEEKLVRIRPLLDERGIRCVKDTTESSFAAALNACSDPIAFNLAIAKLARGGRLSFFSGLGKNAKIETNLLNLLHYREIQLCGAYGLTVGHLREALTFIQERRDSFARLVEKQISLSEVPQVLAEILNGKCLKYIVDLRTPSLDVSADRTALRFQVGEGDLPGEKGGNALSALTASVKAVDEGLRAAAVRKIDGKTKPLGALGMIENLAVSLALIQQNLSPRIERKAVFVFAADHGIAEEGVSAFPAEVTQQMVRNFLRGGAAINVLCRHHGIDLKIVDMGVNADLEPHPLLIAAKIRKGTRNFALEPAMTRFEARQALLTGARVFDEEFARAPISIVGLGEMGIANTTSASAIVCAVTGISPRAAAGRGTGLDDCGLEHKIKVLSKVLAMHEIDGRDGLEVLRTFGGFEIAGIAGAILAAAAKGCAVVLDGLISTAGGLIAGLLQPAVKGYLISGHRSVEVAQGAALNYLGLSPVVDFGMRLGEGTGAAMAIDVVAAAGCIMSEMASFEEAGVSRRS